MRDELADKIAYGCFAFLVVGMLAVSIIGT